MNIKYVNLFIACTLFFGNISNGSDIEKECYKPLIIQNCGISSVYVICQFFGIDTSLSKISKKTNISNITKGISIKYICDELELQQLHTMPILANINKMELLDKMLANNEAIVLHSPFHHFVCFGKIEDEYIVADNGIAKRVSGELLAERWDGYAIRVSRHPLNEISTSTSILSIHTICLFLFLICGTYLLQRYRSKMPKIK